MSKDYKVSVMYPSYFTYYVESDSAESALNKAKEIDDCGDPAEEFETDFDAKAVYKVFEKEESPNGFLDKWKPVQVNNSDEKPTYEQLEETLRMVVDYIAVSENTAGQLEKLSAIGFSSDILKFFGYSQADIDSYVKADED